MLLSLLKWLGIRSKCCGARKEFRMGYSYKDDGNYCTNCDERA